MPSVAEAPLSPCIGKKRRRDEDVGDAGTPMKLASPHHRRPLYDPAIFSAGHGSDTSSAESHFRHIIAKTRRHDSKRQRIPTSYDAATDSTQSVSPATHERRDLMMDIDSEVLMERKEVKVDLSPCHICRRKPTAKHELDSFAHCESCGKRTCYVCIRECLGTGRASDLDTIEELVMLERRGPVWHNSTNGVLQEDMLDFAPKHDMGTVQRHRGKICSHCCEERGTEGDVWCLGCLVTNA